MSRLRSDTFIKPGSESSYDSEDNGGFSEPTLDAYCCISNVSMKKAVVTCGSITAIQMIVNFSILLKGCGITMLDICFAILPVVTGTTALLFLTFALLHHSSTSLKPYIVHHVVLLLASLSFFTYYILQMFHQKLAADIAQVVVPLSGTFDYLTNVAHSSVSLSRFLLCGFMALQIAINVFCLHIVIGLYLLLDNFVRYVSAECTEVV